MVGSRCGGIFEGDENEQIRLDETHSERLLFTETALSKGESCTKIIAYAKRRFAIRSNEVVVNDVAIRRSNAFCSDKKLKFVAFFTFTLTFVVDFYSSFISAPLRRSLAQ
uniref:FHA domain-containing protein n=1 Tax=Parascaris univalens TaxID=6257 RepID=A0A915B3S4_PARUN